tara:strand:- start:251 stop:439 length:189 start_codon:yes stop_codon:yes gene_type:complete
MGKGIKMYYVVVRFANGLREMSFQSESEARIFACNILCLLNGEEMWKNDDTFNVTVPQMEIN